MSEDATRKGEPSRKRRNIDSSTSSASNRRALSCTECKRRRTRCSTIGQAPCEACIKRHRPSECIWEGIPPKASAPPSSTGTSPSSDINDLRRKIDELQSIIATHLVPETSKSFGQPPLTRSLSQGSFAELTSPEWKSDEEKKIELVVGDLEISIAGPYPGSRFPPGPSTTSSAREVYSGVLAGCEPGTFAGTFFVESFFDGDFHKGWTAIERSSFMSHYNAISQLPSGDQWLQVAPAWLAEYTMIIALSIKFGNPEQLQLFFPGRNTFDIQLMPSELYRYSLRALEEAQYLAVPQMRHVQVSLLYIVFLFHFGETSEDANIACRHLDSAITTAQWLGLDETDNKPDNLPLDDPVLVGLTPWAAKEVCKRLYHMLSFIDGTIVRRGGRFRLREASNSINVTIPGNYSEMDLVLPVAPAERSKSEITHSTLARSGSAFANAIRRNTSTNNIEIIYEAVLVFDGELRQVLVQIPWTLGNMSREAPQSNWMMPHLLCSIHNRLLRIHRPHLLQGYFLETKAPSRLVSLDSARKIINIQHAVSRQLCLRPGFLSRWILGAALVLAIDAVLQQYVPDINAKNAQPNKSPELSRALEVLRNPTPCDANPSKTRHCAEAVQAILEIIDERQAGVVKFSSPEVDLQGFLTAIKVKLNQAHSKWYFRDLSDNTADAVSDTHVPLPDIDLFDASFDWLTNPSTEDAVPALDGFWQAWFPE